MDETTLSDFEQWASQYPTAYDLRKTPAMRTENPFADSVTWKAYEAWCDSKAKYAPPNINSTTCPVRESGDLSNNAEKAG